MRDLGASLKTLYIPFIENRGRHPAQVKYFAATSSSTVFVTEEGSIVYALASPHHLALREQFVESSTRSITARKGDPKMVSQYRGADPQMWCSTSAVYSEIYLDHVYKGIDVALKAHPHSVEKLFCVSPGADPNDIRIALSGSETLCVDDGGALVVTTEVGEVKFTEPVAYQEKSGQRRYVDVEYAVYGEEYGFRVGEYDARETLVIDPLLASTLLGGSGDDGTAYRNVKLTLTEDGCVYLTGITESVDFPATPGAYENQSSGDADIFIAKLNEDLTALLSASYIGGSGADEARGIRLDAHGNVYVAGITVSPDFPVTSGASDTSYNGGAYGPYGSGDIFVVKLDGDLQTLLASTFHGGSSHDCCNALAVKNGSVFISGGTASSDFPVTGGVFDETYNAGGNWGEDVFVTAFNGDLSVIEASTFIGGGSDDFCECLEVDAAGYVYIAGWLQSTNFPTTDNAYARTYRSGPYDAFVAKFDGSLSELVASTYLGGSNWDFGYGLGLDSAGAVYVTGHTASLNFPTSSGAFSGTYNGDGGANVGDDVFITKLDNSLSTLLASTYLGGGAWENAYSLRADGTGNVYVAGTTSSADFPTTATSYDTSYPGGTKYAGDIFISKLDSSLSELLASTYLGGSGAEGLGELCVSDAGAVYIAGSTSSPEFPTTYDAFSTQLSGGDDVVVVKFDAELSMNEITADFSAEPLSGHAPLQVQFSDLSVAVNPLTSWRWDFDGDGSVDSEEQHPVWMYQSPGTYSVILTAYAGAASHTYERRDYIRVFEGGSALEFNGTDSYARCPATDGLHITGDFCFEAWMYPTGWGENTLLGFGRIMDKGKIALYLVDSSPVFNDNSLSAHMYFADNSNCIFSTPQNSIVMNEWQHVAVSYEAQSGKFNMYINGIAQQVTATTAPSSAVADNSAVDLYIGNSLAGNFTFEGILDEIRLWKTARSESQINNAINAQLFGTEMGLAGYWPLEEGYNTVITDASGHGGDGTLFSTKWVQGVCLDPSGVSEPEKYTAPKSIVLHPNFPNPCNPTTTIAFEVPYAACVQLSVYDMAGRLVKVLAEQKKMRSGYHALHWDGTDTRGESVSSGVYIVSLVSRDYSSARKLVLIK